MYRERTANIVSQTLAKDKYVYLFNNPDFLVKELQN